MQGIKNYIYSHIFFMKMVEILPVIYYRWDHGFLIRVCCKTMERGENDKAGIIEVAKKLSIHMIYTRFRYPRWIVGTQCPEIRRDYCAYVNPTVKRINNIIICLSSVFPRVLNFSCTLLCNKLLPIDFFIIFLSPTYYLRRVVFGNIVLTSGRSTYYKWNVKK